MFIMKEVVIVSAVRTPVGTFYGALSVPAVELGAIVIKEAMQRAGISGIQVDEVIMGNVLQSGLGHNPARQAALKAGIPQEIPSWTLDKVCGSGLKAVVCAAQSIIAGDAEIIIAGGMENISLAHYTLPILVTADNIAKQNGFSREEQDRYSVISQNRTETAIKAGRFEEEIVAVTIPRGIGDPIVIDQDGFPRFGTKYEELSMLMPAFDKDGTITAGNTSGINDGAAAMVVMSKEKAESLGLTPLATITSWASAGVDPLNLGTGLIPATRKALEKARLKIADIDVVEANEDFASQSLIVAKELQFDMKKTNINGGAIALGHPIGATGSRILVSLIHEMKRQSAHRGLATLSIGGGQGISMILERKLRVDHMWGAMQFYQNQNL